MLKIAINGLGRIGRMVLRSIFESNIEAIEVVAINDPMPIECIAHLLKYDSVHGQSAISVDYDSNVLKLNGKSIYVHQESSIENIHWGKYDVDTVYECSGKFTTYDSSYIHIKQGAKKVLVSAPCKNAELTVVYGVNHKKLHKNHKIISCASCTTNCLAPLVQILHNTLNIQNGQMTTVHAYTADQRLQDGQHKDLRRARAAALSIIPTTTGAAKSVGQVIPDLDGKIDGIALRVPTSNVSLIDFTFTVQKRTSAEEINELIYNAAHNSYKNIIQYSDKPLVSIDFLHQPYSAIFDQLGTQVLDHHFCKILAWYDNEWGFSNRMHDVALYWHDI